MQTSRRNNVLKWVFDSQSLKQRKTSQIIKSQKSQFTIYLEFLDCVAFTICRLQRADCNSQFALGSSRPAQSAQFDSDCSGYCKPVLLPWGLYRYHHGRANCSDSKCFFLSSNSFFFHGWYCFVPSFSGHILYLHTDTLFKNQHHHQFVWDCSGHCKTAVSWGCSGGQSYHPAILSISSKSYQPYQSYQSYQLAHSLVLGPYNWC